MNSYILLRAALTMFKKTPSELDSHQFAQAKKQAQKEHELEQRVLNSSQAAAVIIPEAEINNAYQQVRNRYADDASFEAALQENQLTEESLRAALYRQVKVNTVLEVVSVSSEEISAIDIELFYHSHLDRFTRPELREVCHILISINPDYPENSRENAFNKITTIHNQLQQDLQQFADLALQHSECPTSLQGGLLGKVGRGKLYPQLDEVLFSLNTDELSAIVESEMGFHILWCKKIYPQQVLSLKQVKSRIRQSLHDRYQQQRQRKWLASLPALEVNYHA